jgi:hypothetical protein
MIERRHDCEEYRTGDRGKLDLAIDPDPSPGALRSHPKSIASPKILRGHVHLTKNYKTISPYGVRRY